MIGVSGPKCLAAPIQADKPTESELSRERLKSALSTAEGLLLQPRGEGELIALSDDEAVAAAVMLPMVAGDRLAPSASSHTGGEAQCPGNRLRTISATRPLAVKLSPADLTPVARPLPPPRTQLSCAG